MKIKIVGTEDKTKGRLYEIEVAAKTVELLLTWHSLDRIAVWDLKPEQVLETLLFPGHSDIEFALQVVFALFQNNMVVCPTDFCHQWWQFLAILISEIETAHSPDVSR